MSDKELVKRIVSPLTKDNTKYRKRLSKTLDKIVGRKNSEANSKQS